MEDKKPGEMCGIEQTNGVEETRTREITQTDHLNRKLLDSFLARLNSGENEFPVVQRMDTSDGAEGEFEVEQETQNDTSKSVDNQSVKE